MRAHRLGAALLLIAAATAPAHATRPDRPLHVLLIHSYEREFEPHGPIAEAFQKELSRQSPHPISFFDVSLQPARTSAKPDDGPALDYLLSTFAGQRLDLIVSIGGPAALFAMRHREQLFPATPLLLASIDRHAVDPTSLPPNTAAVAVANDGTRAIETALALLPDTTTVYVVIGTSALEEFWRAELGRDLHRFRDRVSFRWLNGLSFPQILAKSASLPPHSVIFYSLFALDAQGVPQVEQRALAELRAVANAPIFGFHSGQLGIGIVGGSLMSLEEITANSTSVALRLLDGEPPAGISVPTQVPGTPIFDWRELRRWNIAESRLPPDSVVRFRQPTLWQQYKWQIAAGSTFALIEAGLVVALLTVQVKRRRAERALRDSEERFRLLADSAPAMVWMSGPDGRRTDFNRGWLDFTGRTIAHEGGDPWIDGVHADDASRVSELCAAAFERREPFRIEYRLRRHDGEYRWILDTGLPRFEAAAFAGYIGSSIDVTDLKLARAALSNLSHRLMQAHEGERTWIARELHEDLGQRLAGLTMQLHHLSLAAADTQTRARVDELCRYFGDLGKDLQAISYRLYSYRLEYLGLAAAVDAMCEEASRQHSVAIDFNHDGVPRSVPRDVALGLFLVLQKALDNAVRHSKAQPSRWSCTARRRLRASSSCAWWTMESGSIRRLRPEAAASA